MYENVLLTDSVIIYAFKCLFSTSIYNTINSQIYSLGECIIEMFYREETPSSSWLSKVSRMYVLIDTNCLIYFAYCSILETSVIAYAAQFISNYNLIKDCLDKRCFKPM